MAGAFDDLTADLGDDLTRDLPPGKPQDPNSLRLNFGLGYNADVPVPEMLRPVAKGAAWLDKNVAAPVARGFTGIPGFVGDSLKFGYDKLRGNPTNFGGVTKGLQDTMDIAPRPHDAGFGTDVLEAVGGGGGVGGPIRAGIGAVTSVLGQYGGGWAGEKIGGETGRTIGEIVGGVAGGVAPTAAEQRVRTGIRNQFQKEGNQSAEAFRQLQEAGVTPRPGLVGNKQAARAENSAANFPFVGGPVQRTQSEAFRQFQRSLYGASDEVAPRMDPSLEIAPGPDNIGARMRIGASAGEDALKDQFRTGYDDVFNPIPRETLVKPNNLDAEITRQADPFVGESAGTNQAVQGFRDTQIEPKMLASQGPTQPTGAPVSRGQGPSFDGTPVDHTGVPIQVARKARTEAFYDAQGGRMKDGATEQARGAWTRDIEDAIMNDPAMIRAFPDPAARTAQVERLRVLDTEYALANAKDVSRSGAAFVGDNMVVGGDFPTLKGIQNVEKDSTVFAQGSDPGRMAVLQRTMPPSANPGFNYPNIAADTIREKAQSAQPFGDINISPQVFASWWNQMDPNSRAIFANEPPVPGYPNNTRTITPQMNVDPNPPPSAARQRLDNLGQVGELFRQSGLQANPSGTAPTLAMMGVLGGLFARPIQTGKNLLSAGALANLSTSEEMARIIAGADPSAREALSRALAASAGRAGSAQANQLELP